RRATGPPRRLRLAPASPCSIAASSSGHRQRAREEVPAAEIAGLQRHLHFPVVAPDRAHKGHAGGDLRPKPEGPDAETVDRRPGRLAARDDEPPHADPDEAGLDRMA